jgi:hypothetical protein
MLANFPREIKRPDVAWYIFLLPLTIGSHSVLFGSVNQPARTVSGDLIANLNLLCSTLYSGKTETC